MVMLFRSRKHIIAFVILNCCIVYYIATALPNKTVIVSEHHEKETILKPIENTNETDTRTSTPSQKTASVNITFEEKKSQFEHLLNQKFPLSDDLKNPTPGYSMGHIKENLEVIIGVPTVKREKENYLPQTIQSLLSNLNPDLEDKVGVLVYFGESDKKLIVETYDKIRRKFEDKIDAGVLQVISPSANYYPDWNKTLESSFGDHVQRVKWRSKQNLDQIFLMMYIYNRSPSYYLMMEDDVISSPEYMQRILQEAKKRDKNSWFFLSFCQLGAIGKLFQNSMLPSYASFLHLFWNKKPLDWLQDDFVSSAYCSLEGKVGDCQKIKQSRMVKITPSLFQHIGKYSSLSGKLQNRKDKNFPKKFEHQ